MAIRFAKSNGKILNLSDGDWVEVKEELSIGDARKRDAYAVMNLREEDDGLKYELDPAKLPAGLVLAAVTGWSGVDKDGNPVPFDEAAFLALAPESAKEIERVVGQYYNPPKPKPAPTPTPGSASAEGEGAEGNGSTPTPSGAGK